MPTHSRRPRGPGRPAAPLLSRERITDAAIALVDEKDYRHLTMSSLSKRLGVSTSALYNHVASKREVMVLIQDRLNAEIDCSGFDDQPWDEALRTWARSYRRCYTRHTALIPVMAVLPVADSPQTLQMYERVARGLERAGLEDTDVVDVIVGVEALVFGAAYDASAPTDIFDPGGLAELAPTFSRLAAARAEAPGDAADRAFELALEALIRGLRTQLSGEVTPRARA